MKKNFHFYLVVKILFVYLAQNTTNICLTLQKLHHYEIDSTN